MLVTIDDKEFEYERYSRDQYQPAYIRHNKERWLECGTWTFDQKDEEYWIRLGLVLIRQGWQPLRKKR